MSDHSAPQSKGLLDSLSTLTATFVAIAQTRLDLFFAELEEDRHHLLTLLGLALVALFCFGIGVVLATILVVVAFWDSHRLLVLGMIAVIFLATGAAACAYALQKVRKRPRMFAASLLELRKDHQRLVSQKAVSQRAVSRS